MLLTIIRDLLFDDVKDSVKEYPSRLSLGNKIIVTAEQYLKMYRNNKDSVKGARLLPAELGEEDFGKFVINNNKVEEDSLALIDE